MQCSSNNNEKTLCLQWLLSEQSTLRFASLTPASFLVRGNTVVSLCALNCDIQSAPCSQCYENWIGPAGDQYSTIHNGSDIAKACTIESVKLA